MQAIAFLCCVLRTAWLRFWCDSHCRGFCRWRVMSNAPYGSTLDEPSGAVQRPSFCQIGRRFYHYCKNVSVAQSQIAVSAPKSGSGYDGPKTCLRRLQENSCASSAYLRATKCTAWTSFASLRRLQNSCERKHKEMLLQVSLLTSSQWKGMRRHPFATTTEAFVIKAYAVNGEWRKGWHSVRGHNGEWVHM